MDDSGLIRVTYVKSAIGYSRRQKETIRALGLRRLGDAVIVTDHPAVRGMVQAVAHLLAVEPVAEPKVVAERAKKGRAEP